MKYLQSIVYGFVSGISEFLPISSDAHQLIIGSIFGLSDVNSTNRLFIHIAILLAVYIETAKARARITVARQKLSTRASRKIAQSKAVVEYRFLRKTAILFLIVFFLLYYIAPEKFSLLSVSLALLINGIVIFLTERMLQGNKNASVMSDIDGALIGIIGALSVFPGFSRIGCMLSASALRGADRKASVNWVLLLSIPAIWTWIILDAFSVFTGVESAFWSNFLINIVSAIFAFIGTRTGIYVLRRYITASGFVGYAYYCWGAALLSLILFLTVA